MMLSALEPFVVLLVLFLIFAPLLFIRLRYSKRYVEAFESIASSLQKMAENKK